MKRALLAAIALTLYCIAVLTSNSLIMVSSNSTPEPHWIFGWFGRSPQRWQEVVRQKRESDNDKIPEKWKLSERDLEDAFSRQCLVGKFIDDLLDDDTRRITKMDTQEIVENIKHHNLTAVQVTESFCRRAAYAHQLGHLLLEIGFEIAMKRARELDEYQKRYGKLIGPLHGSPVTLKDQFHIKGLGTTMGYVSWVDTFEGEKNTGKEKNTNSQLVEELYALGAIPIGKTTLAQSLWSPETSNNFLGYTRNPYNLQLSTGGSSGGEGAMQALRGSSFGIGTDIGGSVSMPASFQNLYSLKPSSGRLSFKEVANSGPGMPGMRTVPGIMSNSLNTVQTVFQSLISAKPWERDADCLPIPYREERHYNAGNEVHKPAFGYLPHDNWVAPHPPIARALEIARKALEESAYELVDWKPPSNVESAEIHGPVARGDGCPDVVDAINASGEPFTPEIAPFFPGRKGKPPLSLLEYEAAVNHMLDFRARWHKYWSSSAERTMSGKPVEAIISPVTPYAAVLPGKFHHSQYTSVVNVLDYPSVVIPVTFADKEIDTVDPNYAGLSEKDKNNMKEYDPEAYHGAPATIQLIGRKLDEERLLSMAQLVADAIQKYKAKYAL